MFIAFVISGALKQPVDLLEKKKIPRSAAALLIYFIFIAIIFYLFILIIPPLAGEIIILSKSLPTIINKLFPSLSLSLNFNFLSQNIPNITNEAINLIKNAFSNVVFITSTLFFGFYLLLEKNLPRKLLVDFVEPKYLDRVNLIVEKAQKRTSGWFWGEVVLMFIVGTMTYLGLILLHMKYALALAVLAGLLEAVPSLGPISATIPALIIGLSQSYFLGLSMIALYFTVQQLENNLIVPMVMKKAVGIHPIITLIALVIGGRLAGVMGVVLAIPTTIFIETILIDLINTRKKVK